MRTLKYAILGLLSEGEKTGAEISKAFEGILGHFWSAKHSQIYPELKKLKKEHLIEDQEVNEHKTYHLTPQGEDALYQWLILDEAADHTTKDVFCVRMMFSRHVDTNRLIQLIHSQLMQHRANLHYLKIDLKAYDPEHLSDDDLAPYLLTLRAISKEKSYISWLNQCLSFYKKSDRADSTAIKRYSTRSN